MTDGTIDQSGERLGRRGFGWYWSQKTAMASPSTAIRMTKRYGHIGHTARRQAVEMLGSATAFDAEGAQKWAQWQKHMLLNTKQMCPYPNRATDCESVALL